MVLQIRESLKFVTSIKPCLQFLPPTLWCGKFRREQLLFSLLKSPRPVCRTDCPRKQARTRSSLLPLSLKLVVGKVEAYPRRGKLRFCGSGRDVSSSIRCQSGWCWSCQSILGLLDPLHLQRICAYSSVSMLAPLALRMTVVS